MVTVKRERFIVFKIFSNQAESIPLSHIRYSLWNKFQTLYGLENTAKSGMYFVEYNENFNLGLIRCDHKALENILTSMSLISKISNVHVIVVPLFISGLLNKAKKHYGSLIPNSKDRAIPQPLQ
ncbi:MAG: hypothetical protein DRJ35_07885 [Thermoprotei archaeon]|nr:MAG: hypothetical protein DRJ35_07885 [Thermoprotei archaeon]